MATPQSPPSAWCSGCGRVVNYLRVKSNKNGNQGRLLAKCFSLNESTGVRCDFWSWHPDSRLVASSPLQRCPSSDDLEPIRSAPAPSAPLAAASAHVAKGMCSAPGCKSMRIRRDCSRLRCKTHCMELGGGCNSAAHKVNAPTSNLAHSNFEFPSSLPLASNPFGVDPALTGSIFINSQPIASSSSMPVTVPPNSQPMPSSLSGGPRHASHMAAYFTEQWATEHRLLEQKRTEDALRLAHAQKTKQTVSVYVWEHDNKDPLVVEFQDGFVWPYFVLDTNVLRRVGLDTLPPFVSLNLYRPQLNMWTTVSTEHIIHLSSDNTRIFLKPSTITRCKDLRSHTRTTLLSIKRIDVTAERAFMKSQMEQERLERVCATLATPKRSLSPLSADVPPPKRSRLAETIQVIPTVRSLARSATKIVRRKKGDDIVILESDSDDEAPEPFSSPLRQHLDVFSTGSMEPLDDTQIPVERPKTIWPGTRSVNDIVAGFKKIDYLSSQPGYTVSKAFEECFNTRFPSTTFYDHRRRWNSASPTDRDVARVSNMSWASFSATHPSYQAAEKAARKRQQRLLRQVTSLPCQEDEVEDVEYVTDP